MRDLKQMLKIYMLAKFNLMTVNLIGLILKSQNIMRMVKSYITKLLIKRKNKVKKNSKLFLNKHKRKKQKRRKPQSLMDKVLLRRKRKKRNLRKF